MIAGKNGYLCPTREQVRETAACPRCDAPIGTECFASPGASRDKNHIERHRMAIAILQQQVPQQPAPSPDLPEPSIHDFDRRGGHGWRP